MAWVLEAWTALHHLGVHYMVRLQKANGVWWGIFIKRSATLIILISQPSHFEQAIHSHQKVSRPRFLSVLIMCCTAPRRNEAARHILWQELCPLVSKTFDRGRVLRAEDLSKFSSPNINKGSKIEHQRLRDIGITHNSSTDQMLMHHLINAITAKLICGHETAERTYWLNRCWISNIRSSYGLLKRASCLLHWAWILRWGTKALGKQRAWASHQASLPSQLALQGLFYFCPASHQFVFIPDDMKQSQPQKKAMGDINIHATSVLNVHGFESLLRPSEGTSVAFDFRATWFWKLWTSIPP